MKQKLLSLLLALLLLLSFAACETDGEEGTETPTKEGETAAPVTPTGLWEDATYLEAQSFGDGSKTIYFKVEAEGQSIIFIVKTDEKYLDDALLAHGLIAGTNDEYGLYVKTVNGMRAVYEEDGCYWALYTEGSYSMTGISSTETKDGKQYALICE